MGMCCCSKSGSWAVPVIVGVGVAAGVAINKVQDNREGGSVAAASHVAQPEDMPPEFAAWMEAGTPDAHHESLGRFVGDWNAEVTFRMGPDAPEETSVGRQKSEMIYDGRFLRSTFEGDMGGMPFEGMSLMGYDKIEKKFVSIWVDSMSTMIFMESGTYDEATKTYTMTASFTDPMGQKVKSKHVMRYESADRYVFEMHEAKGGGDWFNSGTIVYTRR